MQDVIAGSASLERMVSAVEKGRDRLRRAVAVLEEAHVPYAVCGGHAVAVWVTRADQGGVRNTADLNILLRRTDFDPAKVAMEAAGFVYRHVKSTDMFLDGPGAKARDAVHVIFANEKVKSEDAVAAPDVSESEAGDSFRVVALESLVRMKLVANRDKDRTHLRDFIEVGLIDATWPTRFSPELATRLQHLLDMPDG